MKKKRKRKRFEYPIYIRLNCCLLFFYFVYLKIIIIYIISLKKFFWYIIHNYTPIRLYLFRNLNYIKKNYIKPSFSYAIPLFLVVNSATVILNRINIYNIKYTNCVYFQMLILLYTFKLNKI